MMFLCKFEENLSTGSKIFHLQDYGLEKWGQDHQNHLWSFSKWYFYASLKKIHPQVQKIFHLQDYDLKNEVKVTKISLAVKFWFGCFGFNGLFTVFQSISGRFPERGKKTEKMDESKNVQSTPTGTYYKRRRPLPYYHPNCRTPRHRKFTQGHRTTRPPPIKLVSTIYLSKFAENLSTGSKDTSLYLWPCKWGQGHQNLISSWACYSDIYACFLKIHPLVKEISHFWGKFNIYKLAFDLKIRSRSQKFSKLFELSLR